MKPRARLYFLDNLRIFLIFLVVLFHAGVVYESSGGAASFWIVDPSPSVLPGLLNLMLDIIIMPTLFFISGYLTPASLDRKGTRLFLKARFERLVIPWAFAVLTLIPLYKVVLLYSKGLPQENWTTYFHFSNGILGMSWLWFLPVLFLFDSLYSLLSKLDLPTDKLTLGRAVTGVFLVGMIYTVAVGTLGGIGWTKTPLIDFQNERLLPYFLVFLLGALCHRLGTLETSGKNMKLYIAVLATAWIPMNLYIHVLINFFVRPGEFFFSETVDRLLIWIGFHLSLLSLLYSLVTTFKYYFNRQGRLGSKLGELSYNVYIIHVVVLAVIAVGLLKTDLAWFLKYPILALGTWAASNLIAFGYARAIGPTPRRGSAIEATLPAASVDPNR